MREVRFKGRKKDNGKWVEGNLYETNENRFFIMPKSILWITESDGDEMRSVYAAYEVNSETVSQFTGRKDLNGFDIYEGDIVKYYITKDLSQFYLSQIKWGSKSAGWSIGCDTSKYNKLGGYKYYAIPASNYIEIVGNIHDNPELLK